MNSISSDLWSGHQLLPQVVSDFTNRIDCASDNLQSLGLGSACQHWRDRRVLRWSGRRRQKGISCRTVHRCKRNFLQRDCKNVASSVSARSNPGSRRRSLFLFIELQSSGTRLAAGNSERDRHRRSQTVLGHYSVRHACSQWGPSSGQYRPRYIDPKDSNLRSQSRVLEKSSRCSGYAGRCGWKLGIWRDCLAQEINTMDGFDTWNARIKQIPDYYIDGVIEACSNVGLPVAHKKACSDFIEKKMSRA